jgi:arylsulfatase A-like enzyme
MTIRTTHATALRSITLAMLLLAASTPALAADAARGNGTQRPNILLIISDDIGLDANTDMYPGLIDGLVKQYGPSGRNHPQYQQIAGRPASTPVLNALAKSGMRFTQAWAQPFCSPTRVSMITGLFSVKTGVLDYYNWGSQNHHTFVHDLKNKGGYATAAFGKWHMAGLGQSQYPGLKPKEAGFDLYQGNLNGAPSTYWMYEYHVQDAATPSDKYRTENAPTRSLPGIAPTTYAPVTQVADALQWINDQEKQRPDRPWLAWVAFNNAHITENQRPNPMAVPNLDTLDERARSEMQACGGQFGSANVGTCTDKALHRALTNSLDTIVGRLLQAVDALDRNTYVIFVGDNGTWMFGANREFIDNMYITRLDRSKGSAYESGVRVPLVVRGPGIRAGSSSDVPVHAVDMFSTVLELAGLDVPATVPNRTGDGKVKVDGVSFAPVLLKNAKQTRDPQRDYLLVEVVNPTRQNLRQVAARNTRYKVLCTSSAATASCEFYDLVADPLEEYKLAKPGSCEPYQKGTLRPDARDWNFCRLQEVLAKESALSLPAPPPAG